jgi:choline dehydrogenase
VRYASGDPAGRPADMMIISLNQAVLAMESADTGAGAGALGVWLNHSYSRGTVSVVSRDPQAQPLVRLGMLSDERDLRRMRKGARLLADLATRDPVLDICRASPEQATPELWGALDDDRRLDAQLRATVADAQHGTSTCRMGAPDHAETVVDPECRVLGIRQLRVADASTFPDCPRANTNLATIAIGEKVADHLG